MTGPTPFAGNEPPYVTAEEQAAEEALEAEQGRWQDAILELIRKRVPEPLLIDGGPSDSGDPLDFSLAEISQGFLQIEEQRDRLEAENARLRAALGSIEDISTVAEFHERQQALDAIQRQAQAALRASVEAAERKRGGGR